MRLTVEPREWQKQAFSAWQSSMRGIVSAVTGAGKTTFALLCMQEFLMHYPNGVVLIVVPTVALLDQWYLALIDDLRLSKEHVGVIASGRKEWQDRQFVVAVINSMRSLVSKLDYSKPTFLIVDECHRAGSKHNATIFNGAYTATLGLSATPERQYDDGFTQFIQPALGNIIFEYGYDEAFADGVIVPFCIVNVHFPLTSEEQREYNALTRRIAILRNQFTSGNEERIEGLLRRRARLSWNSPMRVPLAVKLALQHQNERMIVFHESVSQANQIYQILTERGIRATIYHTQLPVEKRRENLRLFKNGYYSCLVCCRALDEGLNVPKTTVGIIASSTSSVRQRIQRLGRVLRQLPGKTSALIYTLYATESEEKRLWEESRRMRDISEVKWIKAKVETIG